MSILCEFSSVGYVRQWVVQARSQVRKWGGSENKCGPNKWAVAEVGCPIRKGGVGSPLQVRYTKSEGGAIRVRSITKSFLGGGGGGRGGNSRQVQKLRKPGPAPHKRTLTLLGGGGGGGGGSPWLRACSVRPYVHILEGVDMAFSLY